MVIPPTSLSTLPVMMPGPTMARKKAILRQMLFLLTLLMMFAIYFTPIRPSGALS
jgi:hypothetical protein